MSLIYFKKLASRNSRFANLPPQHDKQHRRKQHKFVLNIKWKQILKLTQGSKEKWIIISTKWIFYELHVMGF